MTLDKAALLPEGLLPCPFCGGAANVSTYQTESLWSHDQVTYTKVSCDECDIAFQTEPGHEKQAIAAWNTRPAAGAGEVYGPYGWLNGHRGLNEESWELESDPLENSEEYFAIPLYALVDPFKEIGMDGPPALRSLPPDDGFVVVPKEPTPAMAAGGLLAYELIGMAGDAVKTAEDHVGLIYAAMIQAARSTP